MSLFRKFANERDGSILPLFGILIMLLLAVVTIGIDMSQTFGERTRLQTAADMAAVQTGRALLAEEITIAQAEAYTKDAFNRIASGLSANGDGSSGTSIFGTMTIKPAVQIIETVDGNTTTYAVKVKGTAKIPASPLSFMFFDGETGKNMISLGFESETTAKSEAGASLSMALVLDRSGSMGWRRPSRMSSLKKAVASLVRELDKVDPDKKFIRLGAYAYHSYFAGSKPMTWDKDSVRNWVNGLSAGGGTRAYTAIRPARSALSSNAETQAHKNKNEQEPKLFMVYMTDGVDASDSTARSDCRIAKQQGIEVYTVAFQAPSRGQQLLKYCASSPKHYFDAKNAGDLNKAFRDIAREASKSIPFVSG